jgi:hypothetical protein
LNKNYIILYHLPYSEKGTHENSILWFLRQPYFETIEIISNVFVFGGFSFVLHILQQVCVFFPHKVLAWAPPCRTTHCRRLSFFYFLPADLSKSAWLLPNITSKLPGSCDHPLALCYVKQHIYRKKEHHLKHKIIEFVC